LGIAKRRWDGEPSVLFTMSPLSCFKTEDTLYFTFGCSSKKSIKETGSCRPNTLGHIDMALWLNRGSALCWVMLTLPTPALLLPLSFRLFGWGFGGAFERIATYY
uniref:RSN1_TM domain-containing protein n=1 Tax=Rodentolepis nana TaxID=102285 RepID=A0A0R3TVR6_RODNA